jgi:murein DD-endopeptidase MepM/ murein hydrolase activator NlpD
MDILFKPWKLLGLVGGTIGIYLCAVGGLFILISYITINQLPFGHTDAWRWFVGEPGHGGGDGVPRMPKGDDPQALVEWFGGHVTNPFGPGHNGLDFSLVVGTSVRSTGSGQVVYTGWSDAGYGNLVIVQDGDWQFYYGHLSTIDVGVGQDVGTGTVVGLSGNTGKSTGPHLHYEVRYQGKPVDPVSAPTGD